VGKKYDVHRRNAATTGELTINYLQFENAT